jgi:hypothetical protein
MNTTVTFAHQSGSISYNNNINNNSITSTANVTNLPFLTTIQNNAFLGGVVALNHNSSSITALNNVGGGVTVNNNVSSSVSATNNGLSLNANQFGGSGNIILTSGSSVSTRRIITQNLFGGNTNVISASALNSENQNLIGDIIWGTGLTVSATHPASSTSTGGGAFFGKFNDTNNLYNDSAKIIFAVGTGTSTSARKTALSIDSSSVVNISGSLTVTSSNLNIDVSGNVTSSTFLATSNGSSAFKYNQQSTGSVAGVYATSYGKDSLQVYQYQGQPYAFNVNLTANQLAAYTGSEFQWGLQTNGTLSLPGGGSTYFSMTSGSTITGSGGGATKVGLDFLETAMILDVRADTAFNRRVYVDKGMYVSQSVGGANVPALTVNGTNAGSNLAIVATGSVNITGSLTINGTTIIPSLAAGAFYSSVTQTGTANVSQSMTFNNTDINEGVNVNSSTQLTVTNAGTYNIQFSAQIDRISGSGTDTVHIWLKKNGSVVSNSAGAITVSGGASAAKAIASWNYVVNANANDYFELVWQSTDSNIELTAFTSSGNIPAVPSVIVTVTQVN